MPTHSLHAAIQTVGGPMNHAAINALVAMGVPDKEIEEVANG